MTRDYIPSEKTFELHWKGKDNRIEIVKGLNIPSIFKIAGYDPRSLDYYHEVKELK